MTFFGRVVRTIQGFFSLEDGFADCRTLRVAGKIHGFVSKNRYEFTADEISNLTHVANAIKVKYDRKQGFKRMDLGEDLDALAQAKDQVS